MIPGTIEKFLDANHTSAATLDCLLTLCTANNQVHVLSDVPRKTLNANTAGELHECVFCTCLLQHGQALLLGGAPSYTCKMTFEVCDPSDFRRFQKIRYYASLWAMSLHGDGENWFW